MMRLIPAILAAALILSPTGAFHPDVGTVNLANAQTMIDGIAPGGGEDWLGTITFNYNYLDMQVGGNVPPGTTAAFQGLMLAPAASTTIMLTAAIETEDQMLTSSLKRMAVLGEDLNPAAGNLSFRATPRTLTVAWQDVPEWGNSNSGNWAAVQLCADRQFTFHYGGTTLEGGLVGISTGGLFPNTPPTSTARTGAERISPSDSAASAGPIASSDSSTPPTPV